MSRKIAIIRPDGTPVNLKFYNSQELGLAKGLLKLGVSVDVFVAGSSKQVEQTLIAEQGDARVKLFQVPFFKIPEIDHAIYPKIFKLIKEGQYDLIQVNEESELNNYLVSRVARKQGIPVIIYQGMYKQIDGRIRAFFQAIFDRVVLPSFRKNVALAACKTTRAQKHLQAKGFTNTTVIPVGLDEAPFLEKHAEQRDWLKELSLPADKVTLLYVGILENRRNIHFLLDLVKALDSSKFQLLIAGTGPLEQSIAERITKEAISNVIMLGRVEQRDLPGLYELSDLFLLASNYEIYGMVVLESMYHGVPVCSTKTAGPEDLIIDHEDGLLFDDLSIETWSKAINDIIGNNKVKTMADKCRQKVKDHLTWDGVAKRYFEKIISVYCDKPSK